MTTDDRAAALLRERVRALDRHLPRALAGEEEPVHQIRVAARRLRVVIPLVVRKSAGRRARRALRALRDLTRAAGRSRDLDVCVVLFSRSVGEGRGLEPALAKLRRSLIAARARCRRAMSGDLLDLDLARLRRDLRAILAREPEDLFTLHSRLRRARDIGGASIVRVIERIGDSFDPPALHGVRRRVRRLRYSAEVAAAFRDESAEAPKRLKALQDRLGEIHDAWVISAWLDGRSAAAARRGDAEVAAAARKLAEGFQQMARGLHRAYLLAAPAEEVRRILETMGRGESAA